ncbi:MAG: TetR/AcrR family transcriptional regulator [Candidatus Kapabacteria bacterium]|jgi:AcrR family transcriptional regulator|nr:TetR/AcrR family transcriptional regulator [Candidatus Kapabacteria bacterium]
MAKNLKSTQRREREREELREQILDVAMNILIKEGYDAVTIRRLADEIAYTPGALYSYFKDKEEIIFALVLRAAKHLTSVFRAVESINNPLERLWAIGRAYITFAMEHQEYYDLMFIMSTPIQKMAETEYTEGHAAFFILRSTVHDCMQQGYLPKADDDVAAFAMWSFVHGSVSLMIRKRMTMIPEEKYQDILDGAFSFLMSVMLPKHPEPDATVLVKAEKKRKKK